MEQRLEYFDTDTSDSPTTEVTKPDSPRVYTVIRRDMLYKDCLCCEAGMYKLTSFEDSVSCDNCNDWAPRYMTKQEMAAHAAENARHTAQEGQ